MDLVQILHPRLRGWQGSVGLERIGQRPVTIGFIPVEEIIDGIEGGPGVLEQGQLE